MLLNPELIQYLSEKLLDITDASHNGWEVLDYFHDNTVWRPLDAQWVLNPSLYGWLIRSCKDRVNIMNQSIIEID